MGAPPRTVRDHSWPEADGRRAVKVVEAEHYIRQLVDKAPPLSSEQRMKLAALLLAPADLGKVG